jgi:putative PIN family toxin of toxin-antitoxin system
VPSMVRVVLDTNILISGLLYPGKPKKLINLALDGKIEAVSSIRIINELKEVIAREEFRLSKEEQEVMVNFIIRLSRIVMIKSNFKIVKKDPDDDVIIRTAYDRNAKYIVSGDHHLLELKEVAGIKIVTANEMLNLLS